MKYYLGKQGGWEDWFFGSKGAVSYLLTWFSIRDVYVCVCGSRCVDQVVSTY